MLRLLKIELTKNLNYKTFLVLTILYFVLMGVFTASGGEFLKFLKQAGADFDGFDPTRIPLYHFPDIWQNVTWLAQWFKFILAIVIIISITNEFSYKTVKQNIIDGFSRKDFLISKTLTIGMLSAAATVYLFLIILITGLIYSDPDTKNLSSILDGMEFMLAFFLNLFVYLLWALLIGTLIKRSGLAIGLLFLYNVFIENIIRLNLYEDYDFLFDYTPMGSLFEIIPIPYFRYVFQEIQDYVSFYSVAILVIYAVLYFYLNYSLLRKRDLS